MTERFSVYDGEAVDLIAVGIPINDGRADERFISFKPKGPAYESIIGADGSVTRIATHERRYDVEVTLKRSSSHNPQLAAIHAVDRMSTGGAGVGVFLLKDRNGSTLIAGDKCWIVQVPDYEFGKGVSDVTWKFEVVCNHAAVITGGN